MLPKIEGPADFATRFQVSRETRERLEAYARELVTWQNTINLVAPASIPELWHRHFTDSAQLVAIATKRSAETGAGGDPAADPKSWIDLGSGAGFPGLVAAIVLADARNSSRVDTLQPDLGPSAMPANRSTRVTLIESDSRKAAFLRHVSRLVGVPVDILCERAERAATRSNLRDVDVVSARALASLTELLTLAEPFTGPGTKLLLPKGRDVETELQVAERKWNFDSELVRSMTDREARIVVITKLRRA